MTVELVQIYESLSRAHAVLSGMTNTLNQIFDRPNVSQEEALKLMSKGKRIEIYQRFEADAQKQRAAQAFR